MKLQKSEHIKLEKSTLEKHLQGFKSPLCQNRKTEKMPVLAGRLVYIHVRNC